MKTNETEIINKLGLHARASAKLTQLAASFESEIWISKSDKKVNAKSIMGVMMLAAAKGENVTLEASGLDEDVAITSIVNLIKNKFDESH